jgi:hypothetical protein
MVPFLVNFWYEFSRLIADCVSLLLKGTRKEKAYQLPIPHLMEGCCRFDPLMFSVRYS